jgi:CRP-like cAMP-binding protein
MNNFIKSDFDKSFAESEIGQSLDANELAIILSHNKIVDFGPGKLILKQGKMSNGIFIIIQGDVIVTAKMLGEGFANIETLEAGNFIGDISYIENVPCSTSFIAKNHVQCLFLSDVYFKLITNYFPQTKYKILIVIAKLACDRLLKLHHKISEVITNSDMITRSFFTEVMQSLTRPEKITFEESHLKASDLNRLPMFSELNRSDIEILLKHVVPLMAPKQCTLIDKNNESGACYIVIYGAVQSSIIQKNKIAKLSVIGPVTLFAWPTFIDRETSFAITFSTCEKALLLMIDSPTLLFFQNEHASLWYKLFDLICLSILALEKSVAKLDLRLQIEAYNR